MAVDEEEAIAIHPEEPEHEESEDAKPKGKPLIVLSILLVSLLALVAVLLGLKSWSQRERGRDLLRVPTRTENTTDILTRSQHNTTSSSQDLSQSANRSKRTALLQPMRTLATKLAKDKVAALIVVSVSMIALFFTLRWMFTEPEPKTHYDHLVRLVGRGNVVSVMASIVFMSLILGTVLYWLATKPGRHMIRLERAGHNTLTATSLDNKSIGQVVLDTYGTPGFSGFLVLTGEFGAVPVLTPAQHRAGKTTYVAAQAGHAKINWNGLQRDVPINMCTGAAIHGFVRTELIAQYGGSPRIQITWNNHNIQPSTPLGIEMSKGEFKVTSPDIGPVPIRHTANDGNAQVMYVFARPYDTYKYIHTKACESLKLDSSQYGLNWGGEGIISLDSSINPELWDWKPWLTLVSLRNR